MAGKRTIFAPRLITVESSPSPLPKAPISAVLSRDCTPAAPGKGYGGAVTIALGITNEGEVVGIQILDASNETPGLGQNSTKETWNSQYVGMKSDKTLSVVKDGSGSADNGTVNAISGATITSKAVTRAVNVALKFVAAQTGK